MTERGVSADIVYNSLRAYFRPDECTDMFDPIGLQCHNTDTVTKVYTACFAAAPVIRTALDRGERNTMLFTHHPCPPRSAGDGGYRGVPPDLLEEMAAREMSFFSYHIPLDRNSEYSPGNTLAGALGAVPYGEFYHQNGVTMGVLCDSPFDSLSRLVERVEATLEHGAKVYPYGGGEVQGGRLAIMAGGAKNPAVYRELAARGINVFLTGMTNPAIDWVAENHRQAEAHGVSLVGGTHYSTEKFAPMAMLDFFLKLGIEGEFLAEQPDLSDL